jgi:hypothetical protein
MQAKFLSLDEAGDWRDVESVSAGFTADNVTVVAQAGIVANNGRSLRVDIGADAGYSCFRDIRCLAGRVYIGCGECVFVIDVGRRQVTAWPLSGYFGHLYTADDLGVSLAGFSVLVASASGLLCFARDGSLRWHAGDLGIDGVIVDSVDNGVVSGAGEWDPPGGWRSFSLLAATGERLG